MRTLKNISLSVLATGMLAACSTSKTVVSRGEYDDMYGSSKEAAVAYAPTVSKKMESYSPDYLENYNDSFDRMPVDTSIKATDSYYDENYLNSRSIARNPSSDAGYSSGYADGYSEGWNDYAWRSPMGWNNGWNSWNSGWNSWNMWGSPWGWSSFGMYGYVPLANRVFLSWGYPMGYSPWGWNSFGWNSWGYDPWGYGSWAYSPWGYNSFGFNRFGYTPYYGVQPVYANNVLGVDTRYGGERMYGPRNAGRSSTAYNDGFVNTRRPAAGTAASTRRASGTSSSAVADRSSMANRANGRTYSGRPESYDTYTRSSASEGNAVRRNAAGSTGYTSGTRSAGTAPSYNRGTAASDSRSGTYTRSAARTGSSDSGTGYSRGSSSGGSYSSPSSRGFSPSNSGSYSRPSSGSSSSGSYSRGSSSSSSSSGSYSRGGSSSSGGSSSRGPR